MECLEHQNQGIHMLIKGASKDTCCTSALGDFSDVTLLKHSFSYLKSCKAPLVEEPCGCLYVCVPCT